MLIISLALFLTYFVMEPVFLEAWAQGIKPAIDGAIPLEQGAQLAFEPFHRFMLAQTDAGTLAILADLRNPGTPPDAATASLSILIPSFLLGEIEKAFQIGFLIFLPFLIIDLVVAAVLMSMGMMMVPPVIVSLPFKLAFFVVADGWTLLTEALVRSYL
jgi:flagellar biosynthetic protein FliP